MPEREVIERIHSFLKSRTGVRELLEVTEYNLRLLRPLGRFRAVTWYPFKQIGKLGKWIYEKIRNRQHHKNLMAKIEGIRATLVHLPLHVQQAVEVEIGRVMNTPPFEYQQAMDLLKRIEKNLESPEFLIARVVFDPHHHRDVRIAQILAVITPSTSTKVLSSYTANMEWWAEAELATATISPTMTRPSFTLMVRAGAIAPPRLDPASNIGCPDSTPGALRPTALVRDASLVYCIPKFR